MRNTVILLCALLALPAGKICGQKFEIVGGIGIGQCRMQDLRKIQDQRLGSLGLPAKITDDFPLTLHYSGEFNIQLKKISLGFEYYFLTSGSRISYSDYSGEINLDITAIAHGFGPSVMFSFYRTDRLWIGPRIQLPFMFSRFTETNYIRILDQSETTSDRIYSWSIGFFPSMEAKYSRSRLSYALKIGYLFDSKGRLVEENNWTVYLTNQDYLTSNWSGFQFDFRLGYTLFRL